MAIHIGYVQQGLAGLVVAGACFILPAFLIVLAISIAYVIYGRLPAVGARHGGVRPAEQAHPGASPHLAAAEGDHLGLTDAVGLRASVERQKSK